MRLPTRYPGHDDVTIRLQRIDGPAHLTMRMALPVLTPYYNLWGRDVYVRREAFADRMDEVAASSTSGSAAIVGERGFVGLSHAGRGASVGHDGRQTLTITLPAGQSAWFSEQVAGLDGWRQFNRLCGLRSQPDMRHVPAHWRMTEYNTWVEQVRVGGGVGEPAAAALNESLVMRWLDRIDALDLPRGKVVLDFGWHGGRGRTMGDWMPRSDWDVVRTLKQIRERGHVPGLWLAPQQIGADSVFAKEHGDELIAWCPPDDNAHWGGWFPRPSDITRRYFRQTIERMGDWGVGKLKLDLWYGPRGLMIDLLSMFAQVAAEVDPTIEIEGHIADAQVDHRCGVLRTNDVILGKQMDWRAVTQAHFAVCAWSSPHRILNGDFIGGNNPGALEADFVEHGEMYRSLIGHGYACVGLLPDPFSAETRRWFAELLRKMQPTTPRPVPHLQPVIAPLRTEMPVHRFEARAKSPLLPVSAAEHGSSHIEIAKGSFEKPAIHHGLPPKKASFRA